MYSSLRVRLQFSDAIVLWWKYNCVVELSIGVLVDKDDEYKLGSYKGTDLGSLVTEMMVFLDLGNDGNRG